MFARGVDVVATPARENPRNEKPAMRRRARGGEAANRLSRFHLRKFKFRYINRFPTTFSGLFEPGGFTRNARIPGKKQFAVAMVFPALPANGVIGSERRSPVGSRDATRGTCIASVPIDRLVVLRALGASGVREREIFACLRIFPLKRLVADGVEHARGFPPLRHVPVVQTVSDLVEDSRPARVAG